MEGTPLLRHWHVVHRAEKRLMPPATAFRGVPAAEEGAQRIAEIVGEPQRPAEAKRAPSRAKGPQDAVGAFPGAVRFSPKPGTFRLVERAFHSERCRVSPRGRPLLLRGKEGEENAPPLPGPHVFLPDRRPAGC